MRVVSSATNAESRFRDTWIYAGLALILVVLGVQYALKVRGSERSQSQSAFLRWVPHVRQLDDGVNIWDRYNWPNPPIMALILKPFMAIDPPFAGSLLWLVAKMACAMVSVVLVLRMLDRPEHPFPWWGKVLAVGLSVRPIEGDLVHGNVNLFILFTVVMAIHALSRTRDVQAGLWLALGIACKVTPALFLPYLAWKRAWKALAASVVGLILFVYLVPACYFGWQANLDNLHGWVRGMAAPYLVKNEVTSEHQSQSLPSFLERMLRERPSFTKRGETDYEPEAYHNVADLPKWALSLAVKGCLVGFGLLAMFRLRAPTSNRTDWRWMAEFGVVVLGMLIFNERTWKHHAVTLLIPFASSAHALSAFRWSRGQRVFLIGSLVVTTLLMLTTTSGLFESQDVWGKLAQVYGAYLWAFLILLAVEFHLAGQRATPPLATSPPLPERTSTLARAA